jgi:hypothetical protein
MGRLVGIEPTHARATIWCVNHFAIAATFWCRLQDLNPQPTDYKSVALPIELSRHREFVVYTLIIFVASSSASIFKDVECVEATRSLFDEAYARLYQLS